MVEYDTKQQMVNVHLPLDQLVESDEDDRIFHKSLYPRHNPSEYDEHTISDCVDRYMKLKSEHKHIIQIYSKCSHHLQDKFENVYSAYPYNINKIIYIHIDHYTYRFPTQNTYYLELYNKEHNETLYVRHFMEISAKYSELLQSIISIYDSFEQLIIDCHDYDDYLTWTHPVKWRPDLHYLTNRNFQKQIKALLYIIPKPFPLELIFLIIETFGLMDESFAT